MIIGEARVRIQTHEPTILSGITSWQRIIEFRNLLVHGYDVADPVRVFEVTHSSLDQLITDTEALLG